MNKKINPRKRPVNMLDVQKEINRSVNDAIHLAMAIFLTVLKDDFDFDNDQITHAWNRVDKLSQEVAERRISVKDLVDVLEEEYNIELR